MKQIPVRKAVMLLLSLGHSVLTSFSKQMEISSRNWKGKSQKPDVAFVLTLQLLCSGGCSCAPSSLLGSSTPPAWHPKFRQHPNSRVSVSLHAAPHPDGNQMGEVIQIRCPFPLTCWRKPLAGDPPRHPQTDNSFSKCHPTRRR